MPRSPARPETEGKPARANPRARAFTTATVISVSLTLLAGSVVVLTNLVPLRMLSFGERIDLGAMLFVAPVLALVLGIMFEATRMAMSREALPEPRRQQVVRNWQPGRREG
jgi:hypothetical protein